MASINQSKKRKLNKRQRKLGLKKKALKAQKKLKNAKKNLKKNVEQKCKNSKNKNMEQKCKNSKNKNMEQKCKNSKNKNVSSVKTDKQSPSKIADPTLPDKENDIKSIMNSTSEKDESDLFARWRPQQILSADKVSSNWKQLKKILDEEAKNQPPHKKLRRDKFLQKETVKLKEEKCDSWLDGINPVPLEKSSTEEMQNGDFIPQKQQLVNERAPSNPTRTIAMDCEMVGVGFQGEEDLLARVSIVNHFGKLLYDEFVKPIETVKDFRTEVSGVRLDDLKNATKTFNDVQKDVSELLEGRILVGHNIKHDLHCLMLKHPKSNIRDTSRYKPFRKLFGGKTPSLKKLSEKLLGVQIQSGEHDSIEDARATMRIYTLYRKEWEAPRKDFRRRKHSQKEEISNDT